MTSTEWRARGGRSRSRKPKRLISSLGNKEKFVFLGEYCTSVRGQRVSSFYLVSVGSSLDFFPDCQRRAAVRKKVSKTWKRRLPSLLLLHVGTVCKWLLIYFWQRRVRTCRTQPNSPNSKDKRVGGGEVLLLGSASTSTNQLTSQFYFPLVGAGCWSRGVPCGASQAVFVQSKWWGGAWWRSPSAGRRSGWQRWGGSCCRLRPLPHDLPHSSLETEAWNKERERKLLLLIVICCNYLNHIAL